MERIRNFIYNKKIIRKRRGRCRIINLQGKRIYIGAHLTMEEIL
jgi:hypothetical protein